MGACISMSKVRSSKSTNNNNNNAPKPKPRPTTTTRVDAKQSAPNQRLTNKNNQRNPKRQAGLVPCGKRTDFGYAKDFDQRYTIGKLLGHGQFGYTYVATDKANGDRVAVKRIEKNKLFIRVSANRSGDGDGGGEGHSMNFDRATGSVHG